MSRIGSNRVDAKELARMVQLNSVPESYVPTDEVGEDNRLLCGTVYQNIATNRTPVTLVR